MKAKSTRQGSNGLPTYGSQSGKNIFSPTPCGCGSHSIRRDTGECAACYSRANKDSFGGVKPMKMRQAVDRAIEDRQLRNQIDSYAGI